MYSDGQKYKLIEDFKKGVEFKALNFRDWTPIVRLDDLLFAIARGLEIKTSEEVEQLEPPPVLYITTLHGIPTHVNTFKNVIAEPPSKVFRYVLADNNEV